MRYRRLGHCGLKVSVIGLGSWLTMQKHGQSHATALHRTAYEAGINLFDTANAYGDGEAERMVGEALAPFRRDTYVLASKVYFPYGPHPFPGANDRGLSRKHIFDQVDQSLARLNTDYLDLYQCHRYDDETPLDETLEAMSDLVVRGKILYWGVSQWTADQIRSAVDLCEDTGRRRPVSNQPQYNMLQRKIEQEILPTCAELGVGVLAYSPLAEGLLTGKYRASSPPPPDSRAADENQGQWIRRKLTPEFLQKVEEIARIAEGLGVPLAELALAWCLRRPEVSSVIVGASQPAQIEQNVRAADLELDGDVLDRINVTLGE